MTPNRSGASMTIGELADRFGLATHVLRHWESEGLLKPAARVNGRRRYRSDQVARVAMIMCGKAAGFSLGSLGEMLDAPDAASRREVLRGHLAELERRIAEAEAAREMVEHAMTCQYADFTHCPMFQDITERSRHFFQRAAPETPRVGRPCVIDPGSGEGDTVPA